MIRASMKLIALGFVISASLSCTQARQETDVDNLTTRAKTFVNQLDKGDFAAATQQFDATMQKAMPQEKMRATWQALVGQVGAFKQQVGTRATKAQGYDIVFVTCQFAQAKIDVKVVFDGQKKIAGLFFLPAQTTQEYRPPSYVKPGSFQNKEVTVGGGEWALPGTLTLPQGQGPFPALVLIQGSGPQDRDETIGPNKPFRDLAEGLASQGIGVLRYEKRTKAYGKKLASVKNFTVNEETVDDAVAAVTLLQKTPGVDRKRMFVLGHSLGGMILHRVVKAAPEVRGLIAMAGSTRPLDEVVLEQTAYIAGLNGPLSDGDKTKIEALKKELARLNDPDIARTPEAVIMGAPVCYWLDLRKINPPQEAKALSQPMLILQGGKDYQVTEKDFANWKAALSGRMDVVFKFYANLYHLFMPGDKTPADYEKPGHVEKVVVDDIASWIRAQR
jgi:dienelactone hydrolase